MKEQLMAESAGLEARLSSSSTRLEAVSMWGCSYVAEAEMKEKLKKLETRVLELDCASSATAF